MAEQYIIYTMGNEKINKEVQRILGKSGFRWGGAGGIVGEEDRHLDCNYIAVDVGTRKVWAEVNENEYKEITFRELCELPDVYDEYEELAEETKQAIYHYYTKQHKYGTWVEFIDNQDRISQSGRRWRTVQLFRHRL